jgi:hypothetical protein
MEEWGVAIGIRIADTRQRDIIAQRWKDDDSEE